MTMRVLLVEDDIPVQRAVARYLMAQGIDVVQASCYVDAVMALDRYGLLGLRAVITDHDLGSGKLTGLELLRRVPPGILRILVSGALPPLPPNSKLSRTELERSVPVDHALEKPYPLETLVQLLALDDEEVR